MITISDKRASIEKFDALLTVNEKVMIFKLDKKKMSIYGERLRVILFTSQEIWIEGEIKQVNFDE